MRDSGLMCLTPPHIGKLVVYTLSRPAFWGLYICVITAMAGRLQDTSGISIEDNMGHLVTQRLNKALYDCVSFNLHLSVVSSVIKPSRAK